MRRVLLTICLLALTATISFAADLPRAMPAYKAPALVPGYNWTGFYAGINGGYGFGRSSWDAFGTSVSPSGGLAGVTLGYNWQAPGSAWVFGVEGDADWSDIRKGFNNAACPAGCETRNNWLATVRGRVGYAFDRVMPYFTGGLAVGDIHANRFGFAGARETNAGWTAGAGVEAAIADRWTAKLEYLYVDLGNINCPAGSCAVPTNVDFRTHLVRAGVNFRF